LATARTIGGTSFDGTGNIAITTNANLTGVVTSSGNATAIADKAIAIAKLADGTDGQLITWGTDGVITTVAAGTNDYVLTSNGADNVPTFQAAAGGPDQANQTAIEAETNQDTYIPPDLVKHSPGVAKVWCLYEQNGAHSIRGGYNMTSVSDGGGAGDTDLLWATDFSGNETYAIVACGQANNMNGVHLDSQVAGGCTLLVVTDAASATDLDTPGPSVSCFGDQ